MTELLALDVGHGFTKGKTADKQVIVPSVVGPAEQIRFDSGLARDGGICVTVGERAFFVGDLALQQSASVSQTLSPTRTGSNEQLALFYAVASELIGPSTDQVAIVTGLPLGDYNPTNKAVLRDMLKGSHMVQRRGRQTRAFTVDSVHVVPQGMGSLYNLVLDRNGRIRDTDLAGGAVGIVDVGTLTTNFVLVDQLRFIERGSDSIPTGTGEFLLKVAKDLKSRHGLDWTGQLARVDQAVRAGAIELYGQLVSIEDLVKPHLVELSDTVLSKARSLPGWGSGAELRAVVLSGGGSVVLELYIRKAYSHARMGDNPQLDNVTGYLLAGLRKFGAD